MMRASDIVADDGSRLRRRVFIRPSAKQRRAITFSHHSCAATREGQRHRRAAAALSVAVHALRHKEQQRSSRKTTPPCEVPALLEVDCNALQTSPYHARYGACRVPLFSVCVILPFV